MTCISNHEAARGFDLYFEVLSIELSHSFHLSEGNCITIIETVSFLLMKKDSSFLIAGDSCNVNKLWLFSSSVKDSVRFSEINESITIESQISSQYKSNILISTSFIQINQILFLIIIQHYNTLKVVWSMINLNVHVLDASV